MTQYCLRALAIAACVLVYAQPSFAFLIKEFKRYSTQEQVIFLSGAVSMAAYNSAANGDTEKARCIMNWYFGKKGEETPGPRQLVVEIVAAEQVDAAKYHVEGVILGLTDKVCGAPMKPKP